MSEVYENYTVSLTRRQAEALRWTLLKHESAVAIEEVQRQILKILDEKKRDEKVLNENLIV